MGGNRIKQQAGHLLLNAKKRVASACAGGYIDGDIRISGHPKDQRTFARISGYVEQTDVHAPQVPHSHVQSV